MVSVEDQILAPEALPWDAHLDLTEWTAPMVLMVHLHVSEEEVALDLGDLPASEAHRPHILEALEALVLEEGHLPTGIRIGDLRAWAPHHTWWDLPPQEWWVPSI